MALKTMSYVTGLITALGLLLVSTDVVIGQGDCTEEQRQLANLCLAERSTNITSRSQTDPYALCADGARISATITECTQTLFICTGPEYTIINEISGQVQQQLDNTCTQLPATTTPPPTEAPIGCQDWDDFGQQLSLCNALYDTLDELRFNLRLTQYGICRIMQAKVDCFYDIPGLSSCSQLMEATNREIIDQLKFAHLFDCDITVNGILVKPSGSECNFWEWLSCHDPLLKAVGLDAVSESTNLNDIRNYDMSGLYGGIIQDHSNKCSPYTQVSWDKIHRCRNGLAEQCKLLESPRRDQLWYGVLNLMSDVNSDIVQTITFLMDIETTCSSDCNNLGNKLTSIDNCNGDMQNKVTSILTKYSQGQSIAAQCSELDGIKQCVVQAVGSCPFAEQRAVDEIHDYNQYKLSLDICQLELSLTSSPGCYAQRSKENDIVSRCSAQTYIERKKAILNPGQNEEYFCSVLQNMANCYAQYIPTCPALERKYWAAERDLIHGANQMLGCSIAYQTFSDVKIQPISISDCDYKKWVGCLGELWKALDITVNENKLSLDGFRTLLDLMWDNGDKRDRCSKLDGLSFGTMKTCVGNLNMVCEFPTLTVPDGVPYTRALRNPFNINDIEAYIQKTCSSVCSDDSLGDKWTDCLNKRGDSSIFDTYPEDIIYSNYVGQYEKTKCKTMDAIIACLDHTLGECDLYASARAFINKPAISDSRVICGQGPPVNPTPTVNAANKVSLAALMYMLSAAATLWM